jgi:succinate dehydrogenase/fumarate reductase-like Fe-S protein
MTGFVTLMLDGDTLRAPSGFSIATLLLSLQRPSRSSVSGATRMPFCGMGVCGECRVTVDGQPSVLACLTPCREGQRIETGAAR